MNVEAAVTLGEVLGSVPEVAAALHRGSGTYAIFEWAAGTAARESGFRPGGGGDELGPIGRLEFPYHQMGAIDTLDLFGLDELILFAFYIKQREVYKTAADLGANCGLHSLVMSRIGWEVDSYEPDETHIGYFRDNVKHNGAERIRLHECAVSTQEGTVEFVRVLGNTTGSHIAGAKAAPYGELEKYTVPTADIRKIMRAADFIKMDIEGHEARALAVTGTSDWKGTDMMLEVGSAENAEQIFGHLTDLGVAMFPQKVGWRRAGSPDDLPHHHTEGSLFCSSSAAGVW